MPELAGLTDTTFGSAPGTWNLWRCPHCACRYLNPRPNPQTIGLAYQNYYTHSSRGSASLSRLEALRKWGLRNSYYGRLFGRQLRPAVPGGWLLLKFRRRKADLLRQYCRGLESYSGAGRQLLDVGCGNGDFAAFANSVGWVGHGVELDPAAAAVASQQGVRVLGAQVAELRGRFDGHFDAITLSHLIEHVHDPVGVLKDCRELLKPGGQLWLETPNIESVGYGAFGRHWRGLEAPRHLVLFSLNGLRQALTQAGFGDIRLRSSIESSRGIFKRSLKVRGGGLSDVGKLRLAPGARTELRRLLRTSRAAVRQDPTKFEFLTVTAVRE